MTTILDQVKPWYMREFPTDDLGAEIRDGLTFRDIADGLLAFEDVYGIFGVGDSIVRERIFSELAEILGVDYEIIYLTWISQADYERMQRAKPKPKHDDLVCYWS